MSYIYTTPIKTPTKKRILECPDAPIASYKFYENNNLDHVGGNYPEQFQLFSDENSPNNTINEDILNSINQNITQTNDENNNVNILTNDEEEDTDSLTNYDSESDIFSDDDDDNYYYGNGSPTIVDEQVILQASNNSNVLFLNNFKRMRIF